MGSVRKYQASDSCWSARRRRRRRRGARWRKRERAARGRRTELAMYPLVQGTVGVQAAQIGIGFREIYLKVTQSITTSS